MHFKATADRPPEASNRGWDEVLGPYQRPHLGRALFQLLSTTALMAGIRYLALLHWLTGNIGYHHVHHLSSRIPNYHLRRGFAENPELHAVTRLTFLQSLRCARLKLWDEERRELVGFRELRRLPVGG